MKTCTKCGEDKQLSEFYAHVAGAMGLSSKCKDCTKSEAKKHREANKEKYLQYDRDRANRADRVAARAAYQKTPNGIAAANKAKAKYAEKNRKLINERHLVCNLSEAQVEKRRELSRAYVFSEKGRIAHAKTLAKNPDRQSARIALGNAVRDGKIIPWPVCAMPDCNAKPEAHHPDYSQPLSVVWLCRTHHRKAHYLSRNT